MKLIIFALILFLPYTVAENPLLMVEDNSEFITKTADCLLKLSAKYFAEKRALIGSMAVVSVNSFSATHGPLLQIIHAGLKYSVMTKDSFFFHPIVTFFPVKAKNYMMFLEDKSELAQDIKLVTRIPSWNPRAKAIVFYPLNKEENATEVAITFINQLRDQRLLSTYIIIYSAEDDELVSYTWEPYTETNCAVKCDKVYILDTCTNGVVTPFAEAAEAYPLNMKGCPLVTYAVVAEPYVMPPVEKDTSTVFNDAFKFDSGGEINLVKLISEITNTTLILRMSDIAENWGVVYPNGTATAGFGVLKNDSADLLIGNIEVTKTIRKYFDPTVSYTTDEMTWCVPKAGQAPTWDSLIIIFQWSTWLATLIALLVMGAVFHFCFYKEQKRKISNWPTNSLLMTFSMLLGWGANFDPKSATFRILVLSWLCFSMNMAVTYESFLRSFLMHPRFMKQISTETDLIESGITFGGREVYHSYFENNNASSFYLYKNYKVATFLSAIKRSAFDKNFAVVASRRQGEYMDQTLGKGESLIYCFPESDNLYKYGVVLLSRKWFPGLDRLNSIIRSVSENGLITKWNTEFLTLSVGETASDIVPLSMEHLSGVFIFLGIMQAVSTLVFLVELTFNFLAEWKCRNVLARKLVLLESRIESRPT